ncbi:hypothetical protein ACFV06_02630 [Streptomyces sp. NPDC059618]|uniref:hypothetical protein n=1 Tax=Streptomyces sp. NPDC059618 TaxID=3346887 RepID=UPI00367BC723
MPDTKTSTGLTSQYTAQVVADLERNAKEQERVGAEMEALQEQLNALRHDHAVLTNLQQALGATTAPAAPATDAEPTAAASVPRQKASAKSAADGSARGKSGEDKSREGKSAASKTVDDKPLGGKTVDGKPLGGKAVGDKAVGDTSDSAKSAGAKSVGAKSAGGKSVVGRSGGSRRVRGRKADSGKAPAARTSAAAKSASTPASAQPTLVDLIRRYLTEQREPRSAAEVSTALGQTHPERRIQTNVVRTTLENLVARSHAHRAKQGMSVFYTAVDSEEPSAPSAASESAVPSAGARQPVKGEAKVKAEASTAGA